MSHFNVNSEHLNWVAIPANGWTRLGDGCVQCGAKLEEKATLSLSGKCMNCRSWTSEEEDVLEDLEG